MVVGGHRGLAQVPAKRLPQRGLRHAVEVDVVLADELVDLGIVRAPPIVPVERGVGIGRARDHVGSVGFGDGGVVGGHLGTRCIHGAGGLVTREDRAREADGRPEALGPAPAGQVMAAIDIGHRHAPRDIARDAERHERLTGAEAHAPAPQRLMRGVALLPAGEGHHEGPLAVRGLGHGVLGQLAADGLEGLAELQLNVELGGKQPLLHGLGDHGAHGLVRLELLGVALDGIEVARQVEVEVVHRAQLGHFARERALGGDELLRLELMT